jgi:inhibitor of cysteine peptidase
MQALSHVGQPAALRQAAWYAAGVLTFFLVPFLFSSQLDLSNDLYYLVYFVSAGAFLAAYARATETDIVALFTRNLRWSLGLGILAAAFVVFNVLNREDSTAHPDGLYFVFTMGWRGVLYGVVDALILTAFPAAVAYGLLSGQIGTLTRRAGFAGLAFALTVVITATYHLGYEQFRDDGIGPPEIGNSIISVPALLTTNPLGSVVAHASMHLAADIHVYETDTFLPPRTFVARDDFPAEVQLMQADNGRTVELAKGGALLIALPSNPSTGFSWGVAGELQDGLRQDGDPTFIPAGSTQPVAGAGGTELFHFTATENGDYTLNLSYRRPFESAPPEEIFSVDVVVR